VAIHKAESNFSNVNKTLDETKKFKKNGREFLFSRPLIVLEEFFIYLSDKNQAVSVSKNSF
jgi:hypothetical protein